MITRRCFPPLSLIILGLAGLPVIVWAQTTDRFMDATVGNIITWILLFLFFCSLLIWFRYFSGYGLRVRRSVLWGVIGMVTLGMALFRVERVTGTLYPTFAWRWSRARDERLRPMVPAATPVGDTRSVNRWSQTTSADFPQFLGPQRSAAVESIQLALDFERQPPREVWRQEIGAGWSAFSCVNGLAVTMEQRGPQEMVTAYDSLTGQLVWATTMDVRHETLMGGIGPRATPTIHEGYVYSLGATGILSCIDGTDGKIRWQHDIPAMFGNSPEQEGAAIAWGRASSPLVASDLVIVPAGGAGDSRASLAAFQRHDGQLVWKAGQRQASYSSPAIATIGDIQQVIVVLEDFVAGHDLGTGSLLWEYPWDGKSNGNANVSQPVAIGNDRVFLSKGYGAGCRLIQIEPAPARPWQVTEVWSQPNYMRTKLTNVAVYQGHAYGLDDGILSCLELATGERRWKRGRFGHGQILRVSDTLIVQSERGEVALVEASTGGMKELYRWRALSGNTWNNPCLCGKYLLLRNSDEAVCYELTLRGGQ